MQWAELGSKDRVCMMHPCPYQVVSCVCPRVPSLNQSGGWFHRPYCPEHEAVLLAAQGGQRSG